jgi:hypothetical protein
VPPVAYDENALAFEACALLEGDLLLCGHKPEAMDDGDFDRDAVANGDAAPEKDSKPVRLESELGAGVSFGLKIEVEDSSCVAEIRGDEGGDLDEGGVCFLDENIFCPLTEANGELVEAYARNPP